MVSKENDWWTGVIGDRTGIFPANYVQKDENGSLFLYRYREVQVLEKTDLGK